MPGRRHCACDFRLGADWFFPHLAPTATRNCIPVAKPYPGTIESCTCFTTVDGFDAGSQYSLVTQPKTSMNLTN